MFQIVAIAVVGTVLTVMLRVQKPEFAPIAGMATGVLILVFISTYLVGIVDVISEIMSRFNLDASIFAIIMKIIAISYICEFGANVCKDAGESAIATKVELAGKVIILYLTSPIILSLLNLISKYFE